MHGGGPLDLRNVCTELACRMLELSLKIDEKEALKKVRGAIESGAAFDKLCQWIERQGSDAKYAKDPSCLPAAKNIIEVISDRSGYICRMDAESIGICASMLGAGRTVKDAPIDHAAGIVMNAKTGDFVNSGDVVAYLHTNTEDYAQVSKKYLQSLKFSSKPPKHCRL